MDLESGGKPPVLIGSGRGTPEAVFSWDQACAVVCVCAPWFGGFGL